MVINSLLALELGIQGSQSQRIRKRTVNRRNAMDLSNYHSTLQSSSSTSNEDTVCDKSISKIHASARRRICPSRDFVTTVCSTEELDYNDIGVTNTLIRSRDALLGEGEEEEKEAFSSWRRLGILHHQDKSQQSFFSKPITSSPQGSFRRTLSGLWDKHDQDSYKDAAEESKIREEIYNTFRTRINSNIYKYVRKENNDYYEDNDNFLLYES